MQYMTAQEAAIKWHITDRRVRILCAQGKIPGAIKQGKFYQIPSDTKKPTDGRTRSTVPDEKYRYLKWNNDVVAHISTQNNVVFQQPEYNDVVALYTHGKSQWTPEQFTEFLAERVVSRDRRDIEKILFRCGISSYDVLRIAEITRGIHPKDMLWVANSPEEKLDSAMTMVFESVFRQKIDMIGDSVDTPEGYNIKRYGVNKGAYGIFKQRINPLVTDVESEIAVYLLCKRLGVPCCPAFRADKDTVFSEFLYDFSKDYIVHFRRLFDGARTSNEYRNLISVRPQYKDDVARMILIDFITRQDDRHLSNMAIKVSGSTESFYPLYDNGRSLFYEDTEETVRAAARDVETYATSFGYSGTYLDYIKEIITDGVDIAGLIDLNISSSEVADILTSAGFTGYRLNGSIEWIMNSIDIIKAFII